MPVNSNPQSGIGITLGCKVPPATTFASQVQLLDDCEFEGFDTAIIPLPTLAAGTLSKAPGRTDNGSFNGSLYLVPGDAGVAQMIALATSKATVPWQLMLTDGTTPATTSSNWTFNGFVANIKPGNFTGEDAPHLDFTIAISGSVAFNDAT